MSDEIGDVARAICAAMKEIGASDAMPHRPYEDYADEWRQVARAAVNVMKPPSEERIILKVAKAYGFSEQEARTVNDKRLRRLLMDFNAMQDAAKP